MYGLGLGNLPNRVNEEGSWLDGLPQDIHDTIYGLGMRAQQQDINDLREEAIRKLAHLNRVKRGMRYRPPGYASMSMGRRYTSAEKMKAQQEYNDAMASLQAAQNNNMAPALDRDAGWAREIQTRLAVRHRRDQPPPEEDDNEFGV